MTFDQLALERPTGKNCILLRGPKSHREAIKHFGAAGACGRLRWLLWACTQAHAACSCMPGLAAAAGPHATPLCAVPSYPPLRGVQQLLAPNRTAQRPEVATAMTSAATSDASSCRYRSLPSAAGSIRASSCCVHGCGDLRPSCHLILFLLGACVRPGGGCTSPLVLSPAMNARSSCPAAPCRAMQACPTPTSSPTCAARAASSSAPAAAGRAAATRTRRRPVGLGHWPQRGRGCAERCERKCNRFTRAHNNGHTAPPVQQLPGHVGGTGRAASRAGGPAPAPRPAPARGAAAWQRRPLTSCPWVRAAWPLQPPRAATKTGLASPSQAPGRTWAAAAWSCTSAACTS